MVRPTSWVGSKLSDSWNEHNGMCVCVFVCVCVRERGRELGLPGAGLLCVGWAVLRSSELGLAWLSLACLGLAALG